MCLSGKPACARRNRVVAEERSAVGRRDVTIWAATLRRALRDAKTPADGARVVRDVIGDIAGSFSASSYLRAIDTILSEFD